MLDRKFLLGTTVLAGVAALITATTPAAAFAQTPPPQDSAPKASDDKAGDEVEGIVVTGSRIKRSEFNSASPIQVITSEQATLSGLSDTAQLLQSSTLASGSPQVNATISTAFVTDGGPGASTVSLRGLGANRTLVLLNGRRAGPAGTRGAVSAFDLNVIPQSAIDRVEILKDGASSIYGSDAVAGVVNIITKRNTDGIELSAFGSVPFEEGGQQYEFSATWGKTFDRGYFNISGDYYEQKELKLGDRDYTACQSQYFFNADGSRRDSIDARTGQPACLGTTYGQLYVYNMSGQAQTYRLQYDGSGQIGTLVPGSRINGANNPGGLGAPTNWFFVGGPTPSATQGVSNQNSEGERNSSLVPQTRRMTVFAQGGFDITSHVEAYSEILLNRRETKSNGYRQFWTYVYGEDGGDPFSAGFTGPYFFSPTVGTDINRTKVQVDYMRFVGGLKGDFGSGGFLQGWNWDVYYQYSRSDGDYGGDVILDDAVKSAEGRSDFGTAGLFNANPLPRATASCAGLVTPISKRNCVDIPWLDPRFLAGNFTDEEKAFLFDYQTGNTVYTQSLAEGSVSGDLFKLPAGKVGLALGFQVRREEINDTPGAITLAGNAWGSTGAGITKGSDTTKEVFGELEIPILKGLPGAEALTLSLSGRYTDVDSYGSNSTYKIGLDWQITPSFKARATKGTSFRAPGLFELYLANQTGFLGQRSIDPCINYDAGVAAGTTSPRVAANCAADGIAGNYGGAAGSATIVTGGGAGVVKAETSDAYTLGVVWTPSFMDLSVAVDYFDIEINDEITQLGAANIVGLCYNSLTFPTDPLCSQFDRAAGGGITEVRDSFLNIASQKNRGLDLTIRYSHDLPMGAKLTTDGQFTWQFKDTTELFADNVVDNNGVVGDPDFTGIINTRIDKGDWTFTWGVSLIGKASSAEYLGFDSNAAGTAFYKVNTEFTSYHNFSVRKKFDTWSVIVGVANAFDEHPPAVTTLNLGAFNTAGTSILASQYDYYGRRAFVNVTKKF